MDCKGNHSLIQMETQHPGYFFNVLGVSLEGRRASPAPSRVGLSRGSVLRGCAGRTRGCAATLPIPYTGAAMPRIASAASGEILGKSQLQTTFCKRPKSHCLTRPTHKGKMHEGILQRAYRRFPRRSDGNFASTHLLKATKRQI